MDVWNLTARPLLDFARAQSDEARIVGQLSSGLRVQSAEDDPSGLAIAQNLQTRIGGLQQGSENAQTANNLLEAAQGAAMDIQSILQRMHGLIVEAGSGLLSISNLQEIQTEIDQLKREIDAISENASFNGVKLFDGSHDTYVGASPGVYAPAIVIMLNPPPNPDGSTPRFDVYDPQGMPAGFLQNVRMSSVQEGEEYVLLQVTGYSTNPTDPNLGPLGQPGLYLRGVGFSNDPVFTGKQSGPTENISTQAVPTDMGWDFGSGGSISFTNPGGWVGSFINVVADMPNLSAQDVGVAGAFITIDAKQTAGGTALSVNTTGQEGGTVSISLPTLNADALDVSRISIMPPTVYDNFDNVVGADSSNQYAVQDSLARVRYASDSVGEVLATLGAQSVALEQEAGNDATALVNLGASQSAIRDTNVAAASSTLAKDEVLTRVAQSVIAQSQRFSSKLVLTLFR